MGEGVGLGLRAEGVGDGAAEPEEGARGREGVALGSADAVREWRNEAATVGATGSKAVALVHKEGSRVGEGEVVPIGAEGVRGREGEAVGCALGRATVEAVREGVVV